MVIKDCFESKWQSVSSSDNNTVSGQIISDTLWKSCIFIENLTVSFILKNNRNIPIQTFLISPRLLFRKMIISQLELEPPKGYLTEVKMTSIHLIYSKHVTQGILKVVHKAATERRATRIKNR